METILSVGLLAGNDPGTYDAIRTASTLLERLDLKLARSLFPTGRNSGVRGDIVAIDLIIEALLRRSGTIRYTLLTSPPTLEQMRQRLYAKWSFAAAEVDVTHTGVFVDCNDSHRFDLVMCPSLTAMFDLGRLHTRRVVPFVSLTHGLSRQPLLYNFFVRLLLQRTYECDSIVCTSAASAQVVAAQLKHTAELLNEEFGTALKFEGRIDTIPLCVDTRKMQPKPQARSRRQFRLPQEAFIMLYFGRISAFKADIVPLVRVFADIVRRYADRTILLVVAGTADNKYVELLKRSALFHGVEFGVRFITDIPDEQKATLYSCADIFVAPSDGLQESFGIAPIEAMSCGIPQVCADWDGYRDTVVDGETGFLIPTIWAKCDHDLMDTSRALGWQFDHLLLGQSLSVDSESLRIAICTLIDNPDLRRRMSVASRARAEQHYSFEIMSDRYVALFRELTDVAAGMDSPVGKGGFYDVPQYYKMFQHYPSHLLSDGSRLRVMGEAAGAYLDWLLAYCVQESPGAESIFPEIIKYAIMATGTTTEGISYGELIVILRRYFPLKEGAVQRAVLWLLKYDVIRTDLYNVAIS